MSHLSCQITVLWIDVDPVSFQKLSAVQVYYTSDLFKDHIFVSNFGNNFLKLTTTSLCYINFILHTVSIAHFSHKINNNISHNYITISIILLSIKGIILSLFF